MFDFGIVLTVLYVFIFFYFIPSYILSGTI